MYMYDFKKKTPDVVEKHMRLYLCYDSVNHDAWHVLKP